MSDTTAPLPSDFPPEALGDPPRRRPAGPPPRLHRVPRKTGDLGMALFLASLAALFLSSMLGYVLVRVSKTRVVMDPDNPSIEAFPATAPPLGTIGMPVSLWVSTIIILASSVTIHLAVKYVQRERQFKFRLALGTTLGLSLLFLIVQTPSMWQLLSAHDSANVDNTMFGVIFFLVLIHALHVIGGIAPLAVVTYRAGQHRYDHEHYAPVRHVAHYWHFLDVIWIFMFGVFLITG
ncbi:MAG: cytochrome c oxidase subunit 3 [Planctomycetota bacterium]